MEEQMPSQVQVLDRLMKEVSEKLQELEQSLTSNDPGRGLALPDLKKSSEGLPLIDAFLKYIDELLNSLESSVLSEQNRAVFKSFLEARESTAKNLKEILERNIKIEQPQ